MKKWIGLMALATAASSVSATSFYDSFNYTAGANLDGSIAPNGQPWSTGGTSVGAFSGTIGTGSLSYPGLPVSQGNDVQWGSSTANAVAERVDVGGYNTGTVYWSMEFEVTNITGMVLATNTTGGFVAGFNNSVGTQTNAPTVVGAKLVLRQSGTVAGDYNFGTSNNGNTPIFDTTDNLTVGTTYFVVGEYDFLSPGQPGAGSTDIENLWVNPVSTSFDSSVVPAPTLTHMGSDLTNGPGYSIASFFLRQNTSSPSGAGSMVADDVRVSNSWAGVTPMEWTATGPSIWGAAGSWSAGAIPSGVGADVTFGSTATSYNVTLDSSQTAGTIRFNGTNNYTIAPTGGATLTLDNPTPGDLNVVSTNTGANAKYVGNAANPAAIVISASPSVSGITHTISAPIVLNRSTELTVPTGYSLALTGGVSANFASADAAPGIWLGVTGGGNVSITPAGTSAFTGLTGLSINGNLQFTKAHSVIVVNAGSAVSATNMITNFNLASGSTLDLTNNDLIVNRNTGDGSTETAILNAVEHARDNGAWDQTGITSSTAATTPGTSLAYVDNALLSTPFTSVDGQAVTNLSIIVKYTWLGDLNLDGVVDGSDLALMGTVNSTSPTNPGYPGWASGDLNYDGVINQDDYALFELGAAESASRNISVTPEPSAALGLAVIGLIAIRRRKATCQ